jgi:hypothetical protein
VRYANIESRWNKNKERKKIKEKKGERQTKNHRTTRNALKADGS